MPSSNICQFRQSAYFGVFCQSLAAKQPSRLPNRLCQWRNAIAPAVIVIFASPSLMCYRHWSSLAQHAYCAQSTNKWRLVWQWEIRPRRRTKRRGREEQRCLICRDSHAAFVFGEIICWLQSGAEPERKRADSYTGQMSARIWGTKRVGFVLA